MLEDISKGEKRMGCSVQIMGTMYIDDEKDNDIDGDNDSDGDHRGLSVEAAIS